MKIAVAQRLAIVPPDLDLNNAKDIEGLRILYGPKGFTPDQQDPNVPQLRVSPLPGRTVIKVEGQDKEVLIVDLKDLPPAPEGEYDFYAVYFDERGNEPDLSPVVTLNIDVEPPPMIEEIFILGNDGTVLEGGSTS